MKFTADEKINMKGFVKITCTMHNKNNKNGHN